VISVPSVASILHLTTAPSEMNLKDAFTLYIREQSSDGSNRASSYIRAIDLLDSILSRKAAAALG